MLVVYGRCRESGQPRRPRLYFVAAVVRILRCGGQEQRAFRAQWETLPPVAALVEKRDRVAVSRRKSSLLSSSLMIGLSAGVVVTLGGAPTLTKR